MSSPIKKSIAYEDSAVTLLARVRTADYAVLRDSGVEEINVNVFDRELPESPTFSETLDHDDITQDPYRVIIHNELQNDGRWQADSEGFNFEYILAPEALNSGNTTFRAEIQVIPTSGEWFHLIYDIETLNLYST